MEIKKSIDDYLQWKGTHTNNAVSRYRVRLKHFLDYITQFKTKLEELNGDDITAYHRSMEHGYSKTTIAYSARILRNFFNFWHGRRMIHFSPKEIIPIRFISADREIVTIHDFEDMMEALSIAGTFEEMQKKIVVRLLWDTGMRVSELCDMTLESISDRQENGQRSAKVRSRKSLRHNHVVWSKETDDLLIEYLGFRLDMDTESDDLFLGKGKKKGYSTRTIQRWIREICDLAMIDKELTPHSFRHGKAHAMLDNGASVRDVQAVLRHVKPESSFHYMKVSRSKFMNIASNYLTT